MGVEMPHFSHMLSLAGPTSAPLLSAHNALRLPFKCICFECLTQKKFCWSLKRSFDKTQTRCHYVYVILNVLLNVVSQFWWIKDTIYLLRNRLSLWQRTSFHDVFALERLFVDSHFVIKPTGFSMLSTVGKKLQYSIMYAGGSCIPRCQWSFGTVQILRQRKWQVLGRSGAPEAVVDKSLSHGSELWLQSRKNKMVWRGKTQCIW
jgi:hypothetical protein